MEWRHNGSPRHQYSKRKNSLEKFSPRFFRIKTASSSLIIFQRAKLSTRSITPPCWCNLRTFWMKNAGGNLTRWTCSFPTKPCFNGYLQSRRNWPTWAFNVWSPNLISGCGPVGLPRVPWTEKNNWKFAIFRPMRNSLLPRRPGCWDKFFFFFFFFLQI